MYELIRGFAKEGRQFNILLDVCRRFDNRPYAWKVHVRFGNGRGRVEGLPYRTASYYDQKWGKLSDFVVSTAPVDSLVTDDEGNTWRVVVNQFIERELTPSAYHFVAHRVSEAGESLPPS